MFLGHIAFLAFQQCFCQSETFYLKQGDCFQHALSCGTTGRGSLQSCSMFGQASPMAQYCCWYSNQTQKQRWVFNADPRNVCVVFISTTVKLGILAIWVLERTVKKCFSAGSCCTATENLLPEMVSFIKLCLLIYTNADAFCIKILSFLRCV